MQLNSMRKMSILAGVVLLLAATAFWQETSRFPVGRSGEPGPALWPRILIVVVVLGALYMIFDMLRSKADSTVVGAGLRYPLGLMVSSIAWLALLVPVGFFLSTSVYLAASMWMLRVRSWWVLIGVTVGFPIVAYTVFVLVLQISFPRGLLALSMEAADYA